MCLLKWLRKLRNMVEAISARFRAPVLLMIFGGVISFAAMLIRIYAKSLAWPSGQKAVDVDFLDKETLIWADVASGVALLGIGAFLVGANHLCRVYSKQ